MLRKRMSNKVSLIRKDVLSKLIQRIDEYDDKIEACIRKKIVKSTLNTCDSKDRMTNNQSFISDVQYSCEIRNNSIISNRYSPRMKHSTKLTNKKLVKYNDLSSDGSYENDFDDEIVKVGYSKNLKSKNLNNDHKAKSDTNTNKGSKNKTRYGRNLRVK